MNQKKLEQFIKNEKRRFDGAQPLDNEAWIVQDTNINTDIQNSLLTLRARSNYLAKNSPWGERVVAAFKNNVVGTGIEPQITTGSKNLDKSIEDKLKEDMQTLDITGTQHFFDLQGLCVENMVTDGESFSRWVIEKGQLKQQFLETHQIDSLAFTNKKSGNTINMGVEVNKTGRPIGYHINDLDFDFFSVNSGHDSKFIPYSDMLHIFIKKKSSQLRGIPWFSPVLVKFRHLDKAFDAELIAMRVAACFSVLLQLEDSESDEENEDASDFYQRVQHLVPGLISKIGKNENATIVDPKRPNANFIAFTEGMLRAIAAGFGIAYETISRDFTKANFGNIRASLIDERKYYRILQRFIIRNYCNPTVKEIINFGRLTGRYPRANIKIDWQANGFEWVDPLKDTKAAIDEANNNLNTKKAIVMAKGRNWEDIIEQRKKEIEQELELLKMQKEVNKIKKELDNEDIEPNKDDEKEQGTDNEGTTDK